MSVSSNAQHRRFLSFYLLFTFTYFDAPILLAPELMSPPLWSTSIFAYSNYGNVVENQRFRDLIEIFERDQDLAC